MAADDQRLLSVAKSKSVPVLLVENADDDSDIFARPLGVFSVALDPDGSNDGLFQVDRIALSELKQRDLPAIGARRFSHA